jgi:hypothetical protein
VDTTTIITALQHSGNLIELEVYPNPFNDQINFKLRNPGNNKIEVSLMDLMGREIGSVELKEEKGMVNSVLYPVADLCRGTYLLRIVINGNSYYRKLVKE